MAPSLMHLFMGAALVACSPQTFNAIDGGDADADCDATQICVFKIGSCSSAPICQPQYCGACPAFSDPYCTCDGKTIYLGCTNVPSGFATIPIASAGACVLDGGME